MLHCGRDAFITIFFSPDIRRHHSGASHNSRFIVIHHFTHNFPYSAKQLHSLFDVFAET